MRSQALYLQMAVGILAVGCGLSVLLWYLPPCRLDYRWPLPMDEAFAVSLQNKKGKWYFYVTLRIDVKRRVTKKTSEMKDSVWIRFFTLCRVSVDPWYWYPLWCGADLFQSPLQDPNGFVNVVVHDRQVEKVTVRWPQTLKKLHMLVACQTLCFSILAWLSHNYIKLLQP